MKTPKLFTVTDANVLWILVTKTNISLGVNQHLKAFATHGNDTVLFHYSTDLMDIAAALFIAFAVIGIFGNLISILALSKSVKLRNATTAFIVNLCVADAILCAFSMPLSAVTFLERDWNYGPVLCKLFPLVRYSNGAVSLFSVIAITINRYILVVHPSLYQDMYKPRNVAIMIFLIWVFSLGLLLFPLLEVWGRLGYDLKVGTCTILRLNENSPKMFLYILAFTLPSLVFVFCYSRIFWVVHKSSKQVRKEVHKSPAVPNTVTFSSKIGMFRKDYKHSEMPKDVVSSNRQDRADLKVLKVMMVIFVTFLLCYFPISFVKIFKKEDGLPVLNVIGYLGVYFSSIINPLIYVVMSDEYRKAYKELFCTKSKKSVISEII